MTQTTMTVAQLHQQIESGFHVVIAALVLVFVCVVALIAIAIKAVRS